MKKLALILILLATFKITTFSASLDSIGQSQSTQLDSLKQKLAAASNDTLKAGLYAQLASQYLNYDTIANKKARSSYQEQALSYTMLAIHSYSRYNDTVGLRVCFNNLTKIYISQKKYSQAKWFILQSNTISRSMNDVPNIITSLNTLAGIKMQIKDYSLAMRDLNEALALSASSHNPKAESATQLSYAMLYSHLNEYDKEAAATRRHNFIEDSIHKAEQAQLIAKINIRDSSQRKKKVSLIAYKRTFKGSSQRRIASI